MRRMLAAGWSVTALRDGRELDKVVSEEKPDLLVVDLGLPYVDGFALVGRVCAPKASAHRCW